MYGSVKFEKIMYKNNIKYGVILLKTLNIWK